MLLFKVNLVLKKLLLKILHNYQENTFFNKNRLKLQACNYIYKKGGPGTGVFLRVLRKTYFAKQLRSASSVIMKASDK